MMNNKHNIEELVEKKKCDKIILKNKKIWHSILRKNSRHDARVFLCNDLNQIDLK